MGANKKTKLRKKKNTTQSEISLISELSQIKEALALVASTNLVPGLPPPPDSDISKLNKAVVLLFDAYCSSIKRQKVDTETLIKSLDTEFKAVYPLIAEGRKSRKRSITGGIISGESRREDNKDRDTKIRKFAKNYIKVNKTRRCLPGAVGKKFGITRQGADKVLKGLGI